jgi:hypothetical protein
LYVKGILSQREIIIDNKIGSVYKITSSKLLHNYFKKKLHGFKKYVRVELQKEKAGNRICGIEQVKVFCRKEDSLEKEDQGERIKDRAEII